MKGLLCKDVIDHMERLDSFNHFVHFHFAPSPLPPSPSPSPTVFSPHPRYPRSSNLSHIRNPEQPPTLADLHRAICNVKDLRLLAAES